MKTSCKNWIKINSQHRKKLIDKTLKIMMKKIWTKKMHKKMIMVMILMEKV